jgi:hypothetical protein
MVVLRTRWRNTAAECRGYIAPVRTRQRSAVATLRLLEIQPDRFRPEVAVERFWQAD